jgi:quercetin dioxygenase-like cupin family protein
MRYQPAEWNGVHVGIYVMDRGDIIRRHQHKIPHLTVIVSGRLDIKVFDALGTFPSGQYGAGEGVELPANIDHELRALEPNTVIANLIQAQYAAPTGYDIPETHAGVMHDDGRITPHEG